MYILELLLFGLFSAPSIPSLVVVWFCSTSSSCRVVLVVSWGPAGGFEKNEISFAEREWEGRETPPDKHANIKVFFIQ